MGRRHYFPMRRHHNIPIRSREDVPLRRLGDVPLRRRWVFHLRRTCDVTGTYRETSLGRCHDVLLPGGTIFPGFGVTYNFITYPKIIGEYSYKYKFYNTKMKKTADCKIYSPFLHFKGNGFEFKRLIGP